MAVTYSGSFTIYNASAGGGTAVTGDILAVSFDGTWTDDSGGSVTTTWQWRRRVIGSGSYANIAGETGSIYFVQAGDAGYEIVCVATGTSSNGGTPGTVTSSNSISFPDTLPTNTSLPTISGTPKVGSTLTATTGSWTNSPTSYSYQWKRGGATISGAISSTYTLVTADSGSTISVVVTATNTSGSGAAESSATATITLYAPVNTGAPVISGTPTSGQTLSVSNGTWENSNNAPTSYSYQWKRDGASISGATGSSYTLVQADVGAIITCTVTGTNNGGSASATSSATTQVAQGPKVVFITAGTSSFTIPSDCGGSATVHIIGPGGRGNASSTSARHGGGGGGAYVRKALTGLTAGASISVNVPTGGTQATAWWNSSSTLVADYGRNGAAASNAGGSGGLVANCLGYDVAYAGGNGGTSGSSTGGGGGGGAAGPGGAGKNGGNGGTTGSGGGGGSNGGSSTAGTNASTTTNGAGGQGPDGTGRGTANNNATAGSGAGGGGSAQVSTGSGAGLYHWTQSSDGALAGPGGGGGGSRATTATSGIGGNYGGGSGGQNQATAVAAGDAIIIFEYQPVATTPPSNTSVPTISGVPEIGETVTISPGLWSNSPNGYAYTFVVSSSTSDPASNKIAVLNTDTASASIVVPATGYDPVTSDPGVVITGGYLFALVEATNGAGSGTAYSTVYLGPITVAKPGEFKKPVVSGELAPETLTTVGTTTSGGGTTSTGSTGHIKALKVTATVAGWIKSVSINVGGVSGSGVVRGAIYADNSGVPGALLGYTNAISPATGIASLDLMTPIGVSNGQVFWIAFQQSTVTVTFRTATGSNGYSRSPFSYDATPPDPFGSGSSGNSLAFSADITNIAPPPISVTAETIFKKPTGSGGLGSYALVNGVVSIKKPTATAVIRTPVTFDPDNKNYEIVLSNGDLTATRSSGYAGWASVLATTGYRTGDHQFKFTIGGRAGSVTMGLSNAARPLTTTLGWSTSDIAVNGDGDIKAQGFTEGSLGALSVGDVLTVRLKDEEVWFRRNSGPWNGDSGANPDTGVGGISVAYITGDLFPVFMANSDGEAVTANFADWHEYVAPPGADVAGAVGFKKPTVAGSLASYAALDGAPVFKKPTASGAISTKGVVTGSPAFKKPTVTGGLATKSVVTGSPGFKKPTAAGGLTNRLGLSGAATFKKPTASGVLSTKGVITGAAGFKKATASGAITNHLGVSGAATFKKPTASGSMGSYAVVSGGAAFKKPTASGSVGAVGELVGTTTFKKPTGSGTITVTPTVVGASVFKKPSAAGGVYVAPLVSGSTGFKKPAAAGALTWRIEIGGAPQTKKPTASGDLATQSVVTGAVVIKKPTASGVLSTRSLITAASTFKKPGGSGGLATHALVLGSPSFKKPTADGALDWRTEVGGVAFFGKPQGQGDLSTLSLIVGDVLFKKPGVAGLANTRTGLKSTPERTLYFRDDPREVIFREDRLVMFADDAREAIFREDRQLTFAEDRDLYHRPS